MSQSHPDYYEIEDVTDTCLCECREHLGTDGPGHPECRHCGGLGRVSGWTARGGVPCDDEQRAAVKAYREDERLSRAFDVVKDPTDWRAPIRADVPRDLLASMGLTSQDLKDAVVHYTATIPEITATPAMLRVRATGYRAGPAGP